jgi:hypothetical protein
MKPRLKSVPGSVDESSESEITIQPDGRVYAFGITGEIAAALASLPMADAPVKRRLARIAALGGQSAALDTTQS